MKSIILILNTNSELILSGVISSLVTVFILKIPQFTKITTKSFIRFKEYIKRKFTNMPTCREVCAIERKVSANIPLTKHENKLYLKFKGVINKIKETSHEQ